MMPPNRDSIPSDLMDTDISFPLGRLFDPYNLDHIPESKRLSHFNVRDIAHVKHYKAAVKIFGGPLSRKRLIIAPPMETPLKHRLGLYHDRKTPPVPPVLNSSLEPQLPPEKSMPVEQILKAKEREQEDLYRKWMKERRQFRNNLENMGLNKEWLQRKPDKTEIEKRVLKEMLKSKIEKEVTPPKEETKEQEEPIIVPNIKMPSPEGIKIIERHCQKYHLRLIDIFKQSDINKDWGINRHEFKRIIKLNKIPMSEQVLEDLILSLDKDCNDRLEYSELAIGMKQWKKERRENKRKALSRESTTVSTISSEGTFASAVSFADVPTVTVQDMTSQHSVQTKLSVVRDLDKTTCLADSQPDHLPSETSPIVAIPNVANKSEFVVEEDQSPVQKDAELNMIELDSSSKRLLPPGSDLRLEQRIVSDEAMVDLKRRDRASLQNLQSSQKPDEDPAVIKIGHPGVDGHCAVSTLSGETGQMVNSFRQLKLREYQEIIRLCNERNVPLSPHLLERVLLYPSDRPYSAIGRKVRTPGMPLVSAHFADPPKKPPTPIEVRHRDTVRRSKSGRLLIDSRHVYPQNATVAPVLTKSNLSTGRAFVHRKVDCWMTFEEYNRLTSHLAVRYQQLHGNVSDNAFWPGHLLDKLRLCMPPYDKHVKWDKRDIMFMKVKTEKPTNIGYNTGNSAWQINDDGCIQVGIHDPFRNKN